MRRRSKLGVPVCVTFAAVLTAAPSIASAVAPTPVSKRIVIGRSIGGVAIGQTFTRARAAWGPGGFCPEPTVPGPPGEPMPVFCTWTVGSDGELGDASLGGTRRVESVEIAVAFGPDGLPRVSPLRALRTARGIGLGSSSRAVRKAYPRAARKVISGFQDPYVDYVITASSRVRTTFAVRGPAQRVAQIRIGY